MRPPSPSQHSFLTCLVLRLQIFPAWHSRDSLQINPSVDFFILSSGTTCQEVQSKTTGHCHITPVLLAIVVHGRRGHLGKGCCLDRKGSGYHEDGNGTGTQSQKEQRKKCPHDNMGRKSETQPREKFPLQRRSFRVRHGSDGRDKPVEE